MWMMIELMISSSCCCSSGQQQLALDQLPINKARDEQLAQLKLVGMYY